MAIPMESKSQIWRRIQEGEALEKDIPSLPSIADISLDDSFQEPSHTDLSIAAQILLPNRTPAVMHGPLSSSSRSQSTHSESTSKSRHTTGIPLLSYSQDLTDGKEEDLDETSQLLNDSRRDSTYPGLECSAEISEDGEFRDGASGLRRGAHKVSDGSKDIHLSATGNQSNEDILSAINYRNITTHRYAEHSLPTPLSMSNLSSSSKSKLDNSMKRLSEPSSRQISRNKLEDDSKFVASNNSGNLPSTLATSVRSNSREPTFSSTEGSRLEDEQSEQLNTLNFASPTSTPRPNDHINQRMDALATPLPRKRAFLMGVINSTARPRQNIQSPKSHSVLPGPRFANNFASATPLRQTARPSGRRRSHPFPLQSIDTPALGTESPGFSEVHPDDASFVSAASSHDLTLQRKANASFDPVMGQEVYNRFNVQKLANYQQGLIKQLQDEASSLSEQVQYLMTENATLRNGKAEISHSKSQTRGDLSEVREEQDAEAWLAEKEALECLTQELKGQIDVLQERLARDKERFKERMSEVEQGVGDIIRDLESRLREAEMKSAVYEQKLLEAEDSLRVASAECADLRMKFEDPPADMHSSELAALELLRKENSRLTQEVDALNSSIDRREERIGTLEGSVEAEKTGFAKMQGEWERKFGVFQEETNDSRKRADVNQAALEEEVKELRGTLNETKITLRHMTDLNHSLEHDKRMADDDIKSLRETIADMDKNLTMKEMEIDDLRSRLSSNVTAKATLSAINEESLSSKSLQEELERAQREVGRLNALLEQTPARDAIQRAKDNRITMLEKRNEELVHQIEEHNANAENHMVTPRKVLNGSGFSPMHRQLMSKAMRSPWTPGEPLTDPSWMFDKTGELSPAPLLAEISKLQHQLDIANDSIDDKLDKLEEAGLGVADLTEALADARGKIAKLEAQLVFSVENRQCPDCGSRDRIAKSGNDVLARVKELTSETEHLRETQESERILKGENNMLKDATRRLNLEIVNTRRDLELAVEQGQNVERSKASIEEALAAAKKMVHEFERTLELDHKLLNAKKIEHEQAIRDRNNIAAKLHRTENDVFEAKEQLELLKQENTKLTSALREQENVVDLQEKLESNMLSVDRMRNERSDLVSERLRLQEQLKEVSQRASMLDSEQVKLQASYNSGRKLIDIQTKEIEDLRSTIVTKESLLNKLVVERNHAQTENKEVQAVIRSLEVDLKRVQKDADRIGEDLQDLREQKLEMERRHKEEQAQNERVLERNRSQMRLLQEQLDSRMNQHSGGNISIEELSLVHKNECKGLFVQIRYLKAKFTREAAFRADLGYQKRHLLIALSHLENSEKRMLATLAEVGNQIPKRREFKSLRIYVTVVVFLIRAKRASESWREQRESKEAITLALELVRMKRKQSAARMPKA